MGWSRHTGAIVSLALLATVVANYAVHRHFEGRFQTLLAVAQLAGPTLSEPPLFDPVGDSEPSPIPRYLGESVENRDGGTILPALQIRDVDNEPASPPGRSQPNPVPVSNDAVPIADEETERSGKQPLSPRAIGLDAVRSVIEEELAGASREEREIWFEELKTLPAGVVRDLLKVRKQLHALPSTLHRKDAPAAKIVPRIASILVQPTAQSHRHTLPDWQPTLDALDQACVVSRHNLANATTAGFKRIRVLLVDSLATPWPSDSSVLERPEDAERPAKLEPSQLEGCRLGATVLDLAPGRLLKTGRPLDLAIDGDGWFAVLVGGKRCYTRCGALALDSQRRLCLAVGDDMPVLHPVIRIPDDAREIEVSASGDVLVLRKLGTDSEVAGRLQLAQFPSSARLRPIGGTLHVQTEASGKAELGAPDQGGRGTIQQGCLEQSNVDVDEELADIEQWQALQKAFPAVSRPVTASGPEPASR